MRIERVDDKTVKCFLSMDELEEYEIDYKDFVLRSDKAKEMVKTIIEQAQVEVGYQPPQFAFDLQIMMLPEQGMVLTFSERDAIDSGEQIMEYLREMKNLLQMAKDKINNAGNGSVLGVNALNNNIVQQIKEIPTPEKPKYAVFVFNNIGTVMNYASTLPSTLRVKSELYKSGDNYYLHIMKGSASYENYSRACVHAVEFGKFYTSDDDRLLFLKEHAECLISEKALKSLRVKEIKEVKEVKEIKEAKEVKE